MDIGIKPKTVFNKLLLGLISVFIFNLLVVFIKIKFDYIDSHGVMNLFDFDREANIPTLYSTFLLFICATLLFTIAKERKINESPYFLWKLLGFVFLFLSVDEITMLHERIPEPLQRIFGSSGIMIFAWIVPYALAVILLGVLYLRFLIKLPKKTMLLFVISGGVYLLGAIVFEMLGGLESNSHGYITLRYYILYTFEETFEMLGAILFIYSLLSYYGNLNKEIIINIE